MSQENVEIVRQVLSAVNRRDLGTMDALFPEEADSTRSLPPTRVASSAGSRASATTSRGLTTPSRNLVARSRRPSTRARVGSSRSSSSLRVARGAASPLTSAWASSSLFRAGSSLAWTATLTQPTPSKPPGWRIRHVERKWMCPGVFGAWDLEPVSELALNRGRRNEAPDTQLNRGARLFGHRRNVLGPHGLCSATASGTSSPQPRPRLAVGCS